MSYEEKAFEIIKDSIKSAIFIDEKAKEFYSDIQTTEEVFEHDLSVNLFNTFKNQGISLAIHKFEKSDLENENLKKYLFKDRDLVLLDWQLDGDKGEIYSLKLLSDIVNSNHINFCCIYSFSQDFDQIFNNLLSYFSGLTEEEHFKIKDDFAEFDKELEKIALEFNFNNIDSYESIKIKFEAIGLDIQRIKDKFEDDVEVDSLRKFLLSFSPFRMSQKKELMPTKISFETNSLVINNTIVFVLKKDYTKDVLPESLLRRISKEFICSQNSFIQLLGLEMQHIFNSEGSFIDSDLLNVTSEAIFSHRNYLKKINKSDVPFNTLIKKVLIEHSILKLRTAKLSLLDEAFLNTESALHSNIPSDLAIASMNTFYNSVSIKSLNNVDFPNVNFGDIFLDTSGKYYLCITALCDCLRPSKIKQNYYFVEGESLDIELANTLGDSAFISYLPENQAVSWISLDFIPNFKIIKKDKSAEQIEIETLKMNNIFLEQFRYKPVYIKPQTYNIKTPRIVDDLIQIRRIESINSDNLVDDNGDINFVTVKYITTLRPNYCQRIANHSFTHPVRVGVDFVKK
ncbi:response regulator receiver domain [Flavobacterium sp.]|uniref:response regulator receiver domain n=1 Tax=Flavobacterium sp. TaxID=239 RepID=UPI003752BC46